MDLDLNENYWENRYQQGQTGWDIGYPSPPLRAYIDQLSRTDLRILIPGGGNSYEAEYLHRKGFTHVFVMDLADSPLRNLKQRCPDFPEEHLWKGNFFDLKTTVDLILEQTFFCSLSPHLRSAYARQCTQLLPSHGKLVGVLFDCTFSQPGPPFGGSRQEYQTYFAPYFSFRYFETCYNSIKPRDGRELFICLERKPLLAGRV